MFRPPADFVGLRINTPEAYKFATGRKWGFTMIYFLESGRFWDFFITPLRV
jgi:hypothetical protein